MEGMHSPAASQDYIFQKRDSDQSTVLCTGMIFCGIINYVLDAMFPAGF
jgi:hypothetical protein